MEILKLLFFALMYYIIYNLDFYLKVFLFISSCISISYCNNYLAMPNNELQENYYYQVYLKMLDYYNYFNNLLLKFGCELNKYSICNKIYLGIKFVNDHFVRGRRILMLKCGEKMLIMPPLPLFSKPIAIKEPKHLSQKNYFTDKEPVYIEKNTTSLLSTENLDNEEDINNFLDNLNIDKKND